LEQDVEVRDMTTTETQRPSFSEVVEPLNPAWLAAVMGTAFVPLAISFLTGSWAEVVSAIFIIISVLMLVAILVPWTLRFFMFPSAVRGDLHYPIAASFFPTMPIVSFGIGFFLFVGSLICHRHVLETLPASTIVA
jgi:tellurite resistance protein TehA-like permease